MLGLVGRTPYASRCAHFVRGGRRCVPHVSKRHLFEYSPRTKNVAWNLSTKEEEDTFKEHSILPWKGVWSTSPAGNLVHLWFNKNYSHAIDYFQTLRKFGPAPDTELYNLFFSLLEDVGNPSDVIEYYYDFDPANAMQVDAEPDALTFGYIVKAYATLGDFDGAFSAFKDCKERGLTPTCRTYAMVLELATDRKERSLGDELIQEAESIYTSRESWYERELITGGTLDDSVPEYQEGEDEVVKETPTPENSSEPAEVDIEFLNAKLYFYGVEDATRAEKVLDEEIITKFIPSYNTYQRLIEVYAAHSNSAAVAKTVELMRERGYHPNDTKTKWTLMDCFVKTSDPRVLRTIESSYKRDRYRTDPYCVFYVDWLKKYRAGGGPIKVADELLEKGTRKELAEVFVNCLFQETSGAERSQVYFTGIQDSIPVLRDPRSIGEAAKNMKAASGEAPVPEGGDPLQNYRAELKLPQSQANNQLQPFADYDSSQDEVAIRREREMLEQEDSEKSGPEVEIEMFRKELEEDEERGRAQFDSVRGDIRLKLIEMEIREIAELGIDISRLENFPQIYSKETPLIHTPAYPTLKKEDIDEFKQKATEALQKLTVASHVDQEDYLLDGEEIEQSLGDEDPEAEVEETEDDNEARDLSTLDAHYDDVFKDTEDESDPYDTELIEHTSLEEFSQTAEGGEVKDNLDDVIPDEPEDIGMTIADHYYISSGEKDYKNHEDIVRGLRLKKLRDRMRIEIQRLREKEQKQGTAPIPVAELSSPALDYLRETYIKARTEEIDINEVSKFSQSFDSIIDTLQVTKPRLYKQLYAAYMKEVRGQHIAVESDTDEIDEEDYFMGQLRGLDEFLPMVNNIGVKDSVTPGLPEELFERSSRRPGVRMARSADSRNATPPTPFETE